jgi:hypothetical protein
MRARCWVLAVPKPTKAERLLRKTTGRSSERRYSTASATRLALDSGGVRPMCYPSTDNDEVPPGPCLEHIIGKLADWGRMGITGVGEGE